MEINNAQVVFSEKAYLGIIAETYENVGTETGGIFLGRFYQGKWFILETLDPGPDSIFRPTYFEYDTSYVNHLANKTARFYKNGLKLIGLWHRHPGSFSTFSSTDDATNIEYAKICNNGAISALVNLDPVFRLTIYHVPLSLRYKNLDYVVDSSNIPQEILERKILKDFLPTKQLSQPVTLREDKTPRNSKTIISNERETPLARLAKLAKVILPKNRVSSSDAGQVQIDKFQISDDKTRQQLLLDRIEGEFRYLESQSEYNFNVRMISDHELIVSMNYVREMHNYPSRIKLIFGIKKDEKVYVKADQKVYKYETGFIRRHLARHILPI